MKMVVSQQAGKEVNNDKASLEGGETVQRKSLFGRYSDLEMLSQLKGLALNPCNSRVSQDLIWPLWNQTLRVRKVMALSDTEFPRRKRKLQQFLKDKCKAAPVLASELSNQPNVTRQSKQQLAHASSVSCLLNSVDSIESYNQQTLMNSHSSGSLLTFEDDFQQKQEISEFSFLDNTTEFGSLNKDISFLLDSDESANGSNPMSPQNPTLQEPLSLDLSDSFHSSNSLSVEEPKRMHLEKPRRSIRLLNFIGDCLQRMVIPIGPRFQAEVPEWTGQANWENFNGKDGDSESSRWLGTRVWPIGGRNMETTARAVGKGRPDSCSCVSPGSTDCIKHHILEERLLLQSDLGPAFLSWKFDEMGEVVSKSWTLSEQQNFESLVKIYPLSHGKNLLKHALKSSPSKCKRSILSYYFNVFVPRRMSLQTRSSVNQVDSDDDLAADVNYIDLS